MRTSEFLLSTLKETPSDAEVVSHQLMLRAGLIRRVAAGIYNWMPLGLRVLRRVEHIVREEMERAGALHFLSDNVLNSAQHAKPQRHPVIDAGGDPADQPRPKHQLMADNLSV